MPGHHVRGSHHRRPGRSGPITSHHDHPQYALLRSEDESAVSYARPEPRNSAVRGGASLAGSRSLRTHGRVPPWGQPRRRRGSLPGGGQHGPARAGRGPPSWPVAPRASGAALLAAPQEFPQLKVLGHAAGSVTTAWPTCFRAMAITRSARRSQAAVARRLRCRSGRIRSLPWRRLPRAVRARPDPEVPPGARSSHARRAQPAASSASVITDRHLLAVHTTRTSGAE